MKVTIRGEEWFLKQDPGGAYWLVTYGQNAKSICYPHDLSEQEVGNVRAAWKSDSDERKRQDAIAGARYEIQKARDEKDYYRGCVQIDYAMWTVERDHIWRVAENGVLRREFSELTTEQIARVVEAKEREVQNRGLGGLFRRLLRKTNNY